MVCHGSGLGNALILGKLGCFRTWKVPFVVCLSDNTRASAGDPTLKDDGVELETWRLGGLQAGVLDDHSSLQSCKEACWLFATAC
jgi:hypothetical protein